MSFLLLAARLVLAAIFLLAGATKLLDSHGSRKAFLDFGMPAALAGPAATLLPFLELVVAAALIPTSLAWYGACGALALLTSFFAATALALLRGRRPDCRCFGRLSTAPIGSSTLIRNGAWMACAAFIVWRGGSNPGIALWPWLVSLGPTERRAATVVACAVAIGFFFLINRLDRIPPNVGSPPPPPSKDSKDAEPAADDPVSAQRVVMGIGLPVGTPAPEFELPALTGERRSLRSLRAAGKDVLLIFSSPYCGSCNALAPLLVRWTREMENLPDIVLISRGTVEENLTKQQGFEPSRILLQREFEVAEAYDCDSSPTGVHIGEDGLIRSELLSGGEAIRQFVASRQNRRNVPAES